MKTEVYSWRLSTNLKANLEREARRRKTSVSALLDLAAQEWLTKCSGESRDDDKEQQRLRRAATKCSEPWRAAMPGAPRVSAGWCLSVSRRCSPWITRISRRTELMAAADSGYCRFASHEAANPAGAKGRVGRFPSSWLRAPLLPDSAPSGPDPGSYRAQSDSATSPSRAGQL